MTNLNHFSQYFNMINVWGLYFWGMGILKNRHCGFWKLLFLECIMFAKSDDQVFEDILDLEIIVTKSAPETFLTSKIKSNCLKWLFLNGKTCSRETHMTRQTFNYLRMLSWHLTAGVKFDWDTQEVHVWTKYRACLSLSLYLIEISTVCPWHLAKDPPPGSG